MPVHALTRPVVDSEPLPCLPGRTRSQVPAGYVEVVCPRVTGWLSTSPHTA